MKMIKTIKKMVKTWIFWKLIPESIIVETVVAMNVGRGILLNAIAVV
jgi:hypothetical protein